MELDAQFTFEPLPPLGNPIQYFRFQRFRVILARLPGSPENEKQRRGI